jgi:hypothetical protein
MPECIDKPLTVWCFGWVARAWHGASRVGPTEEVEANKHQAQSWHILILSLGGDRDPVPCARMYVCMLYVVLPYVTEEAMVMVCIASSHHLTKAQVTLSLPLLPPRPAWWSFHTRPCGSCIATATHASCDPWTKLIHTQKCAQPVAAAAAAVAAGGHR